MAGAVTAFAPARVNLIGEHTDYNGGLALPFAITAGITVKASAISGKRVEARAVDLNQDDRFDLHRPGPASGWRAFVRGTVAELQKAGLPLQSAALEITGDVPRGSGLSSSAALEVALALALIALTGRESPGPLELARVCSAVENHWVGAQTGLLDQLASLCGEPRTALRIDFCSNTIVKLPLEPAPFRLVVLDSGEQRAHGDSGYNERRAECARACGLLSIDTLSEATLVQVDQLPPPLDRRARHVLSENARVEAAVEALQGNDLPELGRLLSASHQSLRDQYEVSTEAVERTVKRLMEAGAIGARIVGGGFGGSVLGLLPPDAVAPPEAVEVHPGPGAHLKRPTPTPAPT